MLHKGIRFLLTILLLGVFLGHTLHYWQLPFLVRLESYLYDSRLRLNMPNTPDGRVVIVDIDEKSLSKLGHWPWGRDVLADLVQTLFDKYQVAVMGFDVVLAEPDTTSGMQALAQLAEGKLKQDVAFQQAWPGLRSALDYDTRFSEVIRHYPIVLGFSFNDTNQYSGRQQLPEPLFHLAEYADKSLAIRRWPGFTGNLALIQEAAGTAGHFTPKIDPDGIARKVPLFYQYQDGFYPALSLGIIRKLFADPPVSLVFPQQGGDLEGVRLLVDGVTYSIPVDAETNVLIPFRGEEKSFPYVSAVDVLNQQVSVSELRGKVVLLGASARGLLDQRSTPVGNAYPGVEIHANLIAGMLDEHLLSQPRYLIAFEAGLILCLGGGLAWLLARVNALNGLLWTLASTVLLIGLSQYLWVHEQVVLPLAGISASIFFLYLFAMSWGFWVEGRSKRDIAQLFGQYVPPQLVNKMAADPSKYTMAGRQEELTVLFSDIRGFTSLSEQLTPDALANLLNQYLGEMTRQIQADNGTLDKYIGDAIMAFWGAPIGDKQHARHAVQSALAMQQALAKLNLGFVVQGWPEIEVGIGINTGQMVVGDMGSSVRKAYTVLGDAVNLASRLEGLTKYYGVPIIIGEETRQQIPEWPCRELDKVRVKGKHQAVRIYQPLADLAKVSSQREEAWNDFLVMYRSKEWNKALELLCSLEPEMNALGLCSLYRERIAAYQLLPPPDDWDGANTFESK